MALNPTRRWNYGTNRWGANSGRTASANHRSRAIITVHKHREHPGSVLHRKRTAAIGRAETVATHSVHAEHARFWMGLAEFVIRHQYPEKR